jgi:hypothetical protein
MVSVTNSGSSPLRIRVSVQNWTLSTDGNFHLVPSESDPFYCGKWLRINPVDFRLDPGHTKEMRYTLNVPLHAEDGGYRAGIVFECTPEIRPEAKNGRLVLKSRIITILYEVVGQPLPSGYAKYLKTEGKGNGFDFILGLQNTGKVHFRTKGSVLIKDEKGNTVSETQVPDVPVLPGADREIRIKANRVLLPGKYVALATLDIGRKELIGSEVHFSIEEDEFETVALKMEDFGH